MRKWIVVSFFTVGTGYEKEAQKLEASLKRFGLDYYFYPCEPQESWRANLNYKSQIILDAFDRFPDRDIVFIDADGIVREDPTLFDRLSDGLDVDLAAHFHPYKGTMINGGSLLSGTLWFRNSDRGRRIVEKWHEIGIRYPTIRHQHCLRVAINELAERDNFKVKVFKLPREYTLIFDYYRRDRPRPVIEHFQASRRLRRQVGFGAGLLDSSFRTIKEMENRNRRRVRIRSAAMRRERMITTRDVDVGTG